MKTNTEFPRLKVLTVDDSATIVHHIGNYFKEIKKIEWVGHAFNISQAQQLITERTPQVLILDIMLKEENGFDLLAYINKNHPQISVVVLTNVTGAFYHRRSQSLGATHFLDKSYDFEDLPRILDSIYTKCYSND